MNDKRKAIIIGAGPAGLTAAYELLKNTDIVPVIYEESETAGGISKTICYKGNRMDLGGHRFFSKSDRVMKFWTDLMPVQGSGSIDDISLGRKIDFPSGGPDPEGSENVMLLRKRVSRIFYSRKFFDYPISLKPQTFINMGFSRTMDAGFGYIASALKKRPEKSLEDFMINRFGKPLYGMFFEDYTKKVWGRSPSEISPDWGAQRIKGLSLSRAVLSILKKPFQKNDVRQKNVETSLIEEFIYPKRGPGQFWENLAGEITKLGGKIEYGAKITDLCTKDDKIVSAVVMKNGLKTNVSGDYFISSMPVKDLVLGMDSVPKEISRIAGDLPYRDFMTVGLLLKRLKIKNGTNEKNLSGLVPDCWIYIQERDVKLGRLQIFNNWSPYMVKDFRNTVWAGLEYFCNEGDSMWNMPDNEFIDFAVGELCKIGIIDRDDVLDGVRVRVKKAYPAYFDSYSEFGKVQEFLCRFKNLYCVGRNGQHRYNNMDHSMLTSMEAVNCIMNGDRGKEAVWNVNTENDYAEIK